MTIHEKAAIGFDRTGDSYERGRPEYPSEAVDFLTETLHINRLATVLDQIRSLVQAHPETENHPQIKLPYRTDVYWCEKL